jgi:hypothetical protein
MEVLVLDTDDRTILCRPDKTKELASPIRADDTAGRDFSRRFQLILRIGTDQISQTGISLQ